MAKNGFTLIELLIVIVILGILAMLAMPKLSATRDRAKLASIKSDLRNMMTAQEAYFTGGGLGYTTALSTTQFQPSAGNVLSALTANATQWAATITNASIATTPKSCQLSVGDGSPTSGQITCP